MRFNLSIIIVAALMVLGWAGPVSSASFSVEEEAWTRFDTTHLTLISNLPEVDGVEMALGLEKMYDFLQKLSPSGELSPEVPSIFYAFKDEASFEDFQLPRRTTSEIPDAGYIVPRDHALYGAILKFAGSEPLQLLYKQVVHEVLNRRAARSPLWLRHGMAEFYSTFEVEGRDVRIGLPKWNSLTWILQQRDFLIPISNLMRLEELPALDDPNTRIFFPQCWGLVYYLLTGPDNQGGSFRSYLRLTANGMAHDEAFKHSFEFDEEALEKQYLAYLEQDELSYFSAKGEGKEAVKMKISPLAAHETLQSLADLIVEAVPQQHPLAERFLARALELSPEHGPTWAVVGALAGSREQWDKARDAFAHAVAAQPDQARFLFLHGKNTLAGFRGRRPESEMEEERLKTAINHLRRASELKPDLAEVWVQLGLAHGLSNQPSAEGAEALERAMALLPPTRTDVIFNLILAHARVGNRERVDAWAGDLQSSAAEAQLLARVREIQLQLDYRHAKSLVRERQLDDAIALLAVIGAETQDSNLRRVVAEQLEKLESTSSLVGFSKSYIEAVTHLAAHRFEEAAPLLEALRQMAKPGSQKETVERLIEKAERVQKAMQEGGP